MTMIHARIPELYHSVDMDGIIVDCGERYAAKLGYSMDDVVGTPFFDYAPEPAREDLRASFETWKKTGNVASAKRTQLETRDGDTVGVILTATNRYENDKLAGRDTTMREISHIKILQDLYDVHARPDYDDSAVMRRSVSYIGVIIDCNQSYLDGIGYERDEVIGASIYSHTGARSLGNLAANMENWMAGYKTYSRVWVKRKDGSEFQAGLYSTDETDSDGTVVGRTVSIKPI